MKNLDKIRIRSNEELKKQNFGLKELSQVLSDIKVNHFITGGTLLGAIREKNFIKWDWDVEITILTDEIFDKREKLSQLFIDSGFQISKYLDSTSTIRCRFLYWSIIRLFLQKEKTR